MIFDMLRKPQAAITESSQLAKELLNSGLSDAGVSVNATSAMRSSAVFACVLVISETVAQLPLILYQRIGDRKQRASAHRLYSLLHDMPNDFQTSFDWRLAKTVHILTHGAGYSFINRSVTGDVLELLPMRPEKVEVKQDKNFRLSYVFTDTDGNQIPLHQDQVFRIIGFTTDGWSGVSPIEYHRQSIGISIAADKHSALSFKNGAKHSGILESDGHFSSNEVAVRVRESWDESYGGNNLGKTALLEDGLKWKPVTQTNKDLQYIETLKYRVEDIARIFRIPPHKIGHLERSTNNNIEHQGLEFLTDTMMPWFIRWEQAIARDLLGREAAKLYFAEFLVEGMLRGDLASRGEYYSKAVGGPWMSANEARVRENQNPVNGHDEILKPLNMTGNNDETNR